MLSALTIDVIHLEEFKGAFATTGAYAAEILNEA